MKTIVCGEEREIAGVVAEIRTYSITPTTFEKREFKTSEADTTFKDHYSHRDNSVVRFGINAKKLYLTDYEKLEGTETAIIQGERFEVTLISEVEVATEAYATSGGVAAASSAGVAGTIKSSKSKSTKYTLEDSSKILHHSLEKDVIREAIELLRTTETKTVLVDVFGRQMNAIKIKDGEPETHTVLLYKNPPRGDGTQEIIVIDPSNFTFSSHLANDDIKAIYADAPVEIKTYHKLVQIYKANGAIGSEPEKYRDCVDIAVKLAFGFNVRTEWERLDVRLVGECDVVKAISNQDEIDKSYPKVGCSARVKQSSDLKVVSVFRAIEESIAKKIEALSKIPEIDLPKCNRNYKDMLASASDLSSISELHKYNLGLTKMIQSFAEELQSEDVALTALTALIGEF